MTPEDKIQIDALEKHFLPKLKELSPHKSEEVDQIWLFSTLMADIDEWSLTYFCGRLFSKLDSVAKEEIIQELKTFSSQ